MQGRLKAAIRGIKLPPKKAAAILASVNVPSPKRRLSPFSDKAAIVPPKGKGHERKGKDDQALAATKPVLLLGR